MIHFAYPNVRTRDSEFIGCGRYTAASPEHFHEEEYRLADPTVTNAAQIQAAVSILARESFDAGKSIFEYKDRPEEKYQGDSQDFAYFLSLVSRSRALAIEIESDIWCTGKVICKAGDQPFLDNVRPHGFEIKLGAFLSEKNPDGLFILPLANILDKYLEMLEANHARVLTLDRFRELPPNDGFTGKTILKLHGIELAALVDGIFEKPETGEPSTETDEKIDPPKRMNGPLLALTMVCLIIVLWSVIVRIGKFDDKPGESERLKVLLKNEEWTEPVTGMKFVWIPGGCFDMGCDSRIEDFCGKCERPLHRVCVEGFWMGKYEVTQGEWKRITGKNPSVFKDCGTNCPVENISWNDAESFAASLSKKSGHSFRLPTEAEWEYACRGGGKSQKYAGGFEDETAWYGDQEGMTHPVGQKASNRLGLHDMGGNVWEWCGDSYRCFAYRDHARNNPVNADGVQRVLRGGAFNDGAQYIRCSHRTGMPPGNASKEVGMRVVRSGPQ